MSVSSVLSAIAPFTGLLFALAAAGPVQGQPASAGDWLRVTEDDRAVKIETDKLEAVIPKKNPKQWMTGIEKGTFLDKTTGFREVGDGLMVIDWLMEPGSDEAYGDQVFAKDGDGVGRYVWHTNETEPGRKDYAANAHGTSHRKRMIEGPQLCHRMKPVQPEVIRGKDFVAVQTTYKFEYAAPGRKAGSRWTQLIVFPKGARYFVLMDKIDSVNDSPEMFLRNDTPGCVRHDKGDTFSEMYLSYLSGPKGLRIPSSEFFTPFPPDLKFGYRRDTHKTPEHFIRAYHLRDKKTGKDGPWLAGLTLEPSVVYEAWASQRMGNIIVMIEEIHGKPVKAGESFSAAHIVGYFDTIEEMHAVSERHKGHTALVVDKAGWRLRALNAIEARQALIKMLEQKSEADQRFYGLAFLKKGEGIEIDDQGEEIIDGHWNCNLTKKTFAFPRKVADRGFHCAYGVFERVQGNWRARITREEHAKP